MQISGSIPPHIAQAYGIRPPQPARPAAPLQSPTQLSAPPSAESQLTEKLQSLVGGRVHGVSVTGAASTTPTSNGTFQLYTRAADKIEAAVAVQIGRSIDIKG